MRPWPHLAPTAVLLPCCLSLFISTYSSSLAAPSFSLAHTAATHFLFLHPSVCPFCCVFAWSEERLLAACYLSTAATGVSRYAMEKSVVSRLNGLKVVFAVSGNIFTVANNVILMHFLDFIPHSEVQVPLPTISLFSKHVQYVEPSSLPSWAWKVNLRRWWMEDQRSSLQIPSDEL